MHGKKKRDSKPVGDHILVVDDDPAIRDALFAVLEDEGYEVVTAVNGAEALLYLAEAASHPALIILDLTMPVMDGYEFLQKRARTPALARVPVLVASASLDTNLEDVVDAQSTGALYMLRKPLDLRELLEAIDHLLCARPQRQRAAAGGLSVA